MSGLKNYGRYTDNAKEFAQISTEAGPHNLFLQTLSESGIVSFFALIILVGHYFVRDLNILKSSSGYKSKKIIVIMYWTLILDALVIPTNNLTFYILFFIFRGLLVENSCLSKLNQKPNKAFKIA